MRTSLAYGASGLLLALLASCATYAPKPLPEQNDLADRAQTSSAAALDMATVTWLAVTRNPQLRAQRAAAGVAQAQVFAAGLLADPQVSSSADYPVDHVRSATDPRYPEYYAYAFGLSFDLQSLLLHGNNHAAANADWQQSRLELLWAEWQTIAQARTLYAQACLAADRHHDLAQIEPIYAHLALEAQRAERSADLSADDADAPRALLLDIRTRLGDTDRTALQASAQLRGLLGLSPAAPLPLGGLPTPTLPPRDEVARAAQRLATRRPDLLALQQGYRAQEARVRVAILAQFPDLTLGATRGRDVSNVHTWGGALSLSLPLFDRGRGAIAIQRATREQLREEYQAHLDDAISNVWQLWDELQQLDTQRRALEAQLPQLQSSAGGALRAWQRGDLAATAYLTLVGSYLSAVDTHADLMQRLWADSIALAAELGTQSGLPAASAGA
jgi:outer membrane protein TolC